MVCIQESLTVRVFSISSATLSHTFESGNSLALLFCILTAVLEGWYYYALLEGMTQSQRIAFLLRDCTVNDRFFPPSVTWGNLHLQIPTWPIALCRYHRYSTVQKSQATRHLFMFCFQGARLSISPIFSPVLVLWNFRGISLFVKPLNTNL